MHHKINSMSSHSQEPEEKLSKSGLGSGISRIIGEGTTEKATDASKQRV